MYQDNEGICKEEKNQESKGFTIGKIEMMKIIRKFINEMGIKDAKEISEYFLLQFHKDDISDLYVFQAFINLISGLDKGVYKFSDGEIFVNKKAISRDFQNWQL